MSLPFVTETNARAELTLLRNPNQEEKDKFFLDIMSTFHALENVLGFNLSMHSSGESNTYHNNITAVYYHFLTIIKQATEFQKNRVGKLNFLDLGCGLGTKGFIAKKYGCDSHGVDINEKYLEIAKSLGNTVTKSDITSYCNTEEFKKHNIIYFYTPMRQKDEMQDFVRSVFKNAADDAVIIPFSSYDISYLKEKHRQKWSEKEFYTNRSHFLYYKKY